jgi:Tfp pilus assembly protein PilF
MRIRLTVVAFTASLGVATQMPAQDRHDHGTDALGAVVFPTSCNAAAQAVINRGVAMLHSFWFPEARQTFQSALAADPGCGIAHWGIALTHFSNPMAGGATAPGQAAGWVAAQAGLAAGARDERDRAYINAAADLFRDHATVGNRQRMLAYERALKAIVDRYPQDTEAKIFHAIFQVANAPPTDLTFAQQQRAAETLTGLFRQQPRHPGLAHYIIHAFDSPSLARLALDAAREYAEIAPAAPHAQHMPSHIFTRLGFWDESIRTNRRSADLEPTPGGKSHPLDYLVYAYLQQGRDDMARAAIEEIGGNTAGEYLAGALGSYNALAMPARFALEREDWASAARLSVTTTAASAEAVTHFARGLGAARSGNVALAKQSIAELERLVAALRTQNDVQWTPVVDAQRMAVSSWVAHAEGRHAEAVQLARTAAAREEEVEKHPVTPGPLIPARELLGDLLMVHNQPAEALAEYEATLTREPNRARTITGAARAAKAAGRDEAARRHYSALVALLDAQSQRPELREAREFLAPR